MTDDAIRAEWSGILRQYSRGGRAASLRRKVALMRADKLEEAGVTETDIDRLFP